MHGSARPRIASAADAGVVADLLDRFNREYETPTPGSATLTARVEHLLSGDGILALLCGEPAVGVALVTFRPNVWYEGPVALLDELYVMAGERSRGIGGALLRAAESACLMRGGQLLELNVDGEDHNARRFYERHGYANHEAGRAQPQLYYFRELGIACDRLPSP